MRTSLISYTSEAGFSGDFPEVKDNPVLILVFGARSFLDDSTPFEFLKQKYPNATFSGCSTSGEILGTRVYDDSLAISIIEFEASEVQEVTVTIEEHETSQHIGERLVNNLPQEGLKGVFVMSDGLQVNGTDLVKGINAIVGDEVVVTGGLAGDGDRFEQTWVLDGGMPASGIISAVGFYGNLEFGHGSKGGWQPFGPERTVTRSESNVLYELDDKPALSIYKEYLGEMAEGLPATGLRFPLSLGKQGEQKRLVRTILAVDEESQSMTFAGDIPTGHTAQLMQANFDQLIDGAEGAALMAATENADDVLCIAISCVGRRMVLGDDAEEEVEAVMDVLPEQAKQIGFYSYGELSPYASGACDLHNQTMTLTTLCERA